MPCRNGSPPTWRPPSPRATPGRSSRWPPPRARPWPAEPRWSRPASCAALWTSPRRRSRGTLGRALFYLGREEEAARAFEQGLDEASAGSDLAIQLAADYAQAGMWSAPVRARAFARLTPMLPGTDATTAAGRLALANVAGERLISGVDREHVIALALRAWGGGALLDGDINADIAVFALAGILTFADAFEPAGEVIEAALADTRRRVAAHAMATMSLCRARQGRPGLRGAGPALVLSPAARRPRSGRPGAGGARPGRGRLAARCLLRDLPRSTAAGWLWPRALRAPRWRRSAVRGASSTTRRRPTPH